MTPTDRDRVRIWIYDGKIPFCSRGEIHSALENVDPEAIKHRVVSVEIAALITCYCCGFPLDSISGGERICRVVGHDRA